MQTTEQETRARIEARPRINIRESGDYESWWKRAIIAYSDVERLIGPEPEDQPCERWGRDSRCGSHRRPCDVCAEHDEWAEEILAVVREATDWALYGHGCNSAYMTGRAFAHPPCVYRHARHPKVVVVSWSGGLDI